MSNLIDKKEPIITHLNLGKCSIYMCNTQQMCI